MPSQIHPVGFYFSLSFKGEDAAFQEVSGISKEAGIEEVTCGGENRFKYRLPTVVSSQNLVLKRGLLPQGSQLTNWCANCIDQGFFNRIIPHDVSLDLLNADGLTCMKWMFYKAYPIKYSISDLSSHENTLAIESIELAYTYFQVSASTVYYKLFK